MGGIEEEEEEVKESKQEAVRQPPMVKVT
jgi:hypothetical protein